MPGITQRIGILLLLGLLSAGCGGGKSEESTSRIIAPPASGPGSVAWEAAIAGRTSPVPTETSVTDLEGLSPDRSVLFAVLRTNTEKRFAALDSRTGAVLWTTDKDVSLYTVSDQTIFLVSRPNLSPGNFTLTARDLRSNSVLWQRSLSGRDIRTIFVSGPVVVALTRANFDAENAPAPIRLVALNRNTGVDQWVYERNVILNRTSTGALPRNQVYFSTGGTSLLPEITGLDANNGSVLWTESNTTGGNLRAGNSALYSLSDTRTRHDDTGHIKWQRPLPEGASHTNTPSFLTSLGADDTLYSVFARGFSPFVEALDPATGMTKWESDTPPPPPSIFPGFTYNVRAIDNPVGISEEGNIYYVERFLYTKVIETTGLYTLASLAAEDGSIRWTVPLFNNRGVYNYDLHTKNLVGPNGLVYGLRGPNIVAVRTPDTQ